MNSSIRRASLGEMYWETSKSRTAPPNRTGKADTSNLVMGPIPLRPFTMASQAVFTVLPTGETIPRPVTTTRRLLTRYLYEESTDGGARGRAFRSRWRPDRTHHRGQDQALVRRSLMYSIAC